MPQVLVQVEGRDLAPVLGGKVLLPAQEGTHRRIAHVHRVPGDAFLFRLIGEQPVEEIRNRCGRCAAESPVA